MKKSTKPKKPTKAKKRVKAKKVNKTLPAEFYGSSKRLAFRLLKAEDEELYCGLFTDAKTVEHFIEPLSTERAKASFKKALAVSQEQTWTQRITAIVDRAGKKTIGIASIKMVDSDKRIAEVGILLKPSAQAQRYATEASQALISSAFRRHTIAGITATVAAGHSVGERLVNALGFSRGDDLAPAGIRGPRSEWAMSRETWAKTFER